MRINSRVLHTFFTNLLYESNCMHYSDAHAVAATRDECFAYRAVVHQYNNGIWRKLTALCYCETYILASSFFLLYSTERCEVCRALLHIIMNLGELVH